MQQYRLHHPVLTNLVSRQYDPDPFPNTTTGTPDGVPVPPYTGPGVDTFLGPLGKLDLLDWMNK